MAVSKEKSAIRVRLAPSPTGPFHIGTARTALFNWLFARQRGGVFALRIEDTDRERSKKEFENTILEGLKWLGLDWDEGPAAESGKLKVRSSKLENYIGDFGPYRQSERTEIYKKYLEKLLNEGKAYWCYCTKEELEAERQVMLSQGLPPKYGGHCRSLTTPPAGKRPQVVRFKTPEAVVEFKDIARGRVSFDASLFGDLTIAKDLETPLYNFAAAVDDEEMSITHVIRGEDHLSNTPKQILFQKALGFRELAYAHLPLILNPDRSKMSKRFADAALLSYRDEGYLPQALVNFLALLGWHPKDDTEILSREDLIKKFDLKRVQKAGAVFNVQKLDWLQKEHLKSVEVKELAEMVKPFLAERGLKASDSFLERVVTAERGRIKNVGEFAETAGFFFKLPNYAAELLVWQKEPLYKSKNVLEKTLKLLKNAKENDFRREKISNLLADIVSEEGRGNILWPLRVALSGLAASPDPLEIVEILGKNESLKRIETAILKIETAEKSHESR